MAVGIYKHYTGEKAPNWRGDKVGKIGIHRWLREEFGKPKRCDHCKTEDESKVYDWASKNHEYRRVREDFMRLCRSCHRKYDYRFNGKVVSLETRKKMGLKSKGNQRARKYPKFVNCFQCGIPKKRKDKDTKFCSRGCATKSRYINRTRVN